MKGGGHVSADGGAGGRDAKCQEIGGLGGQGGEGNYEIKLRTFAKMTKIIEKQYYENRDKFLYKTGK